METRIITIDTINADGCENAAVLQCSQQKLPTVLPTTCPCCGRVLNTDIRPIVVANNMDTTYNRRNPSGFDRYPQYDPSDCEHIATYQCGSCKQLFVVVNANIVDGDDVSAYVKAIFPNDCAHYKFSDNIQHLSPDFTAIYAQAEAAEFAGLDKICGTAYRRALEFLVDAYIRYENPIITIAQDDKLSNKISQIQDDHIQKLAKATSWLGNDQTHILIKKPGYTVRDIKYFIENIAKCIDTQIAVQKASQV